MEQIPRAEIPAKAAKAIAGNLTTLQRVLAGKESPSQIGTLQPSGVRLVTEVRGQGRVFQLEHEDSAVVSAMNERIQALLRGEKFNQVLVL